MVESHCDPSCALSDACQQLVPEIWKAFLESLTVRQKVTNDKEYNEGIEQLRSQIDVIDENLLVALGSRMEISRRIGEFKKAHNIAIVQAARWDSILSSMIEERQGLRPPRGVRNRLLHRHPRSLRRRAEQDPGAVGSRIILAVTVYFQSVPCKGLLSRQ